MPKEKLDKVLILLLVMLLAIVKSEGKEITENLEFINNDSVKTYSLFENNGEETKILSLKHNTKLSNMPQGKKRLVREDIIDISKIRLTANTAT